MMNLNYNKNKKKKIQNTKKKIIIKLFYKIQERGINKFKVIKRF